MLVLASQSPRRQEVLTRAGIPFLVRPAEVDESRLEDESPEEHVRRLAREKVEATAARPGDVVLGADTVVVVDGEVLGKPEDTSDAERMLRKLSGREHVVMTGVCVRATGGTEVDVESTVVRFVALSEEEILDYAASGESMDKAGAYAIQGLASKFIDRIEGCYFNVVGLPVAMVYRKLKQLGVPPEEEF
ncbi:MAG TPA: Maf family protein [Bryobacteraceae bacterium]|nr:Maf family protein [Bryobacteraceae bacterium]